VNDSATALSDLESKLAGFVRSYVVVASRGDSSQEEEALRWVCCGLEWLLGGLLQASDGWNGWVDGILPATDMLPDSIRVISTVEVSVRGRALWGEHAGPFWIEPFLGSVQVSDASDSIVSYELKFGDADRGLGKVPFDKHLRRPDWFFPENWLFTFSRVVTETIGDIR
jgi:hypothetical protein